MHFLQRRRLRRDITTVVFSCEEADLSRFAVKSGPCVALEPGRNPLVSPLTQHDGETPELTAALYTALTGKSETDALRIISRDGKGTLSQCSQHFVESMAAYVKRSLQLADEDEARGDEDLPSFGHHRDALSDAWMRVGRWPREVLGLQNRLVRLGTARQAMAQGRPVFTWHGPPVPQFVVVSGKGPYPS